MRSSLLAGVIYLFGAVGSGLAAPAAPASAALTDRGYALQIHRLLLGRAPSEAELAATVQDLAHAPYRIVVHNHLLDSPEFQGRVADLPFLVGLYHQLRGRSPSIHEMLVGQDSLGHGVPRSEILGALMQPRLPSRVVSPEQARLYGTFRLDFSPKRLSRYAAEALARTRLGAVDLRERLMQEADRLGGAEPGLPDQWTTVSSAAPEPSYNVYYGYIHAHTRVSLDAQLKGSPGPFEAFDYARNVAGLDYLGLSDHGEFISTWPWNNEWDLLQSAVDAYNENGAFVALRGFEYSNPIYGHMNVFGTSDFTSTFAALTLKQFYGWLSGYPGAASTFNHPGNYDFLHLEFMHLQFFPAVRDQVVGIELLTHGDTYGKYSVGYAAGDTLGHLDEANGAGWRIASVSAQDNHQGGWGTIDDYRTGVLAPALTQADILEALRQRRFFSTQDKNLSMSLRADGHEMGSIVGPGAKTLTVTVSDRDGEGFKSLDLYKDGQVEQQRLISGAGTWEFTVAGPRNRSYYYVVATQEDGDQAMTAPIWIQGEGGS
ncbi:MAG TPA: CehA/McbA family metallohydrolase [Candidatus Polarisedimenticolia bacterium]|nr:CehA/McbA family metallohydrolase [Candidatus Polarisedimenticolia bacterium]